MSSTTSSVFSERTLRTLRSLRAPSFPANSSHFFIVSRQWEATPPERRSLRQTFITRSASQLASFGYELENLELYAGVPFTSHPLFAHPAFSSFQAVFSGGTLQRLVVLKPLSPQSASFLVVARTLLSLLEDTLHSISAVAKDNKGTGRSSSSPVLRSLFLPLPSLDSMSFRVFRIPGESVAKLLSSLPSSVDDKSTKDTEIALSPHSLAVESLSTVSNIGLFSFLRVDFPLSFIIHKQRTQS